jgi:hypothetical protein
MKKVFLDPDSTIKDYLGVIIRHASGVIYSQQCGCTSTELRDVEGYYVPISGEPVRDEGRYSIIMNLVSVFHQNKKNMGHPISADQRKQLKLVVESIPWWDADENRAHLKLDDNRLDEVTEAWVPILTPDGPGILTWPNCD